MTGRPGTQQDAERRWQGVRGGGVPTSHWGAFRVALPGGTERRWQGVRGGGVPTSHWGAFRVALPGGTEVWKLHRHGAPPALDLQKNPRLGGVVFLGMWSPAGWHFMLSLRRQ